MKHLCQRKTLCQLLWNFIILVGRHKSLFLGTLDDRFQDTGTDLDMEQEY